jgi:hypothetical protein
VTLKDARASVNGTFTSEGSVLQGTVRAHSAFAVELWIDSDAPREELEKLVRVAHANCYAEATLVQPVRLEVVNHINGETYPLPT